jgi:hypothetical protein
MGNKVMDRIAALVKENKTKADVVATIRKEGHRGIYTGKPVSASTITSYFYMAKKGGKKGGKKGPKGGPKCLDLARHFASALPRNEQLTLIKELL